MGSVECLKQLGMWNRNWESPGLGKDMGVVIEDLEVGMITRSGSELVWLVKSRVHL